MKNYDLKSGNRVRRRVELKHETRFSVLNQIGEDITAAVEAALTLRQRGENTDSYATPTWAQDRSTGVRYATGLQLGALPDWWDESRTVFQWSIRRTRHAGDSTIRLDLRHLIVASRVLYGFSHNSLEYKILHNPGRVRTWQDFQRWKKLKKHWRYGGSKRLHRRPLAVLCRYFDVAGR